MTEQIQSVLLAALVVTSAMTAGVAFSEGGAASTATTAASASVTVTAEDEIVQGGGSTTYTVKVTNTGDSTETFTVKQTEVPDGWSTDDNQFDGNNFKQVELDPDESGYVDFTVSVGSEKDSGSVTFGVWKATGLDNLNPLDDNNFATWMGWDDASIVVDHEGPTIGDVEWDIDGKEVTVEADVTDYTGVDSDSVKLNPDGLFNTITMNHESGDTYSASFTRNWGESFNFKISAKDTFGQSNSVGKFYDSIPSDNSGPSISNVDVSYDGRTVEVTADVADDVSGVDRDTVEIEYDTGWFDFFGTTVEMDHVSGDTYEGEFELEYGEKFQYKVTASDNAGNPSTAGPRDEQVARGTAQFQVTNDDDEAKAVELLVDGSQRETVDVAAGETEEVDLTVDPITHRFGIRYEDADVGKTFTPTETEVVPQSGTKDVEFDIPERLASKIGLSCAGDCSFGTYNPENGLPELTLYVENYGDAPLEWMVTTASVNVVEKGSDYLVVEPVEIEAGSFERTVKVMNTADRYDGDGYAEVTLTGAASIEPEAPTVDISGHPTEMRKGVETPRFSAFVEPGSAGTDDQPEPSPAMDHTVTWYVDGEQVAQSNPDTDEGFGALDRATLVADETGEQTVKVVARDPNTQKTASDTVTVDVVEVGGKLVEYRSPVAGTEYELDKWYTVEVEVKNTGGRTHTFEVEAAKPSGTEIKDEDATKQITLDAGETGSVAFQQKFYGVYTQTRGFSHRLYIDAETDQQRQQVDESSVTLERPPAGDLTVQFDDGQGNDVSAEFELLNSDGKVVEEGWGDSILRNLPAGEYTLVASEAGYVDREKTFTLPAETSKTVSLSLPPEETSAEIVDGSFRIVSGSGPYGAGDTVTTEVRVRNTGNRAFEFFVGLSARGDRGVTYDNGGQTGQFVSLEPGAEQTVTLEWVVSSQTPNGSYDMLSSVWFDYPEAGQSPLDSASTLSDAVEVELTEAPSVPIELERTISRYQDSTDQKVGVLGYRVLDGERYRAAVYFGTDEDIGFTGIESATAATTVLKSEERWSSLETERLLAFRATGDGYELVTDPGTARRVYRLYAPGGFEVSDPQSAGIELYGEDEFNDVLHPSQSEVEDVNDMLENKVFIQQQITQSWVKTEYDQYLVVSRAMASTGTRSIIPTALHDRLTDAESVAGAVSVANAALRDTDRDRVRKVLELYVDNVERLDSISEYGSQATVVLGWVLRFSQYQVYADQRIAMMQAALDRASSDSDVSLDPQLRSAMQTVIDEHESLEQKTFNRFKEFLVEQGRTQVINIAKQGSKVFAKKFGSYVVSLAGKQLSKKTASSMATVASGVAGQVLAGLTISNFLYNMDGMYEAGLKAKWAHVVAEELDAVADDYREEHLGAATYDEWNTYRKLNGIHYHALSVYYEGRSGVLNATWVDDTRDQVYTTFGLSNGWTIEDARQRYIENAAELESIVSGEYKPDTIDLAVQSIPEDGSGPVLEVDSVLDFGTVTGSGMKTVTIRNGGDAPLNIESVVAPDGITASVASTELGIGEATELSVTVTESVSPGSLSETVFVHSNDASSPTRVQVAGTVETATDELTGTVVTSNGGDAVSGASVRLDGDLVTTTDPTGKFSVTVEPGTYTLRVTQSDYQSVERTVTVEADETTEESVSLQPEPATLDVSTNVSAATVLVGDQRVGSAPVSVERAPGEYEVVVSAGGYETVTNTVLLSAGERESLSVDLEPARSENQPPVASVTLNQSTVPEGGAVSVSASGSTDPDGSNTALSYDWLLVESPAGADVSPFSSGEQSTVTFAEPGTYTFKVTVTDAAGDTDTDRATVEVQASDAGEPPAVSAFRLSNPSEYTLKLQFDSPDSVPEISVPITAGGDPVTKLTEADFTESDGTYTATFDSGSSGEFTSTLERAANEHGNGASGQEATVSVSGPTEYTVGITSPTQSSPATLDTDTGSELQVTTEVTIKQRMSDSEFQQLVAALADSSPPVSVSVGDEAAPIADLTFSPPSDIEAGTTVPMTLLVEAPSHSAGSYDLTVETDAIEGVTVPGTSATSRGAVVYEDNTTPPSVTATATGEREAKFEVTNEASETRTLELVVDAGETGTVTKHSSQAGTWQSDNSGWVFKDVPPGETVTGTLEVVFDDNTPPGALDVAGEVQVGGEPVALAIVEFTKENESENPPVVSEFSVSSSSGQELTVQFQSLADLTDISVPISSNDTVVTTLTSGDFTERGDTYTATYTPDSDGTFTATLEEAATDHGNEATGQEDSVRISDAAATDPAITGVTLDAERPDTLSVSVASNGSLATLSVAIKNQSGAIVDTFTRSAFTQSGTQYSLQHAGYPAGTYTAQIQSAVTDAGIELSANKTAHATLASEADPTTPTVTLRPATATVSRDGTHSYEVVVDDPPGTISAFEYTVSVANASVAQITAATTTESATLTDITIQDNASVSVDAALGNLSAAESVVLGTVTLTGETPGDTTVGIDVRDLTNASGVPYAYEVGGPTTLTVQAGPSPIVGDRVPTDPDGDGVYEDINGDGRITTGDVQALFANLREATTAAPAYDINGDGRVTVGDVQALFATL